MRKKNIFITIYAVILGLPAISRCVERPIVVIIPSYNNERWVERNLTSVLTQKYNNFKVIFIDDCSTDDTNKKASKLVKKYGQQERVTIIHNEERCGAMANWYKAIHSCDDNVIIVQLDGDDWLAHDYVLAYLNNIYANPDIWLTYGQFVEYPSGAVGYDYSRPFTEEVILRNSFRKVEQLPISHLRTFYAWLFKCIKLEDVLYQGNFYPMTCDKVIMACCIEMAARHHYRVPDVLYVYNNTNQLCDHHVNMHLQHSLAWYVLSLPPYAPLEAPRKVDEAEAPDCVSLIFMSQEKPSEETLYSIIKCKNQYDKIFVLIPEDQAQDAYTSDGSIAFISYTESDFCRQFQHCLWQIKSNYVQLSMRIDGLAIDTTLCAKLLKKTRVDRLFKFAVDDPRITRVMQDKKLPKISFNYQAYAWYPKNYNVADMLLDYGLIWRKQALVEIVGCSWWKSLKDAKIGLHDYVQKNADTSLLLLN